MCHCEMPESCVIRLDDVRDNRYSEKRELSSPGMVMKHFLDEVKFGLGLKFNSVKGILRVSVGMACVEAEKSDSIEGLCWKIRYFRRP